MLTNALQVSPEGVLSYTDATRSFVPLPLAEQHLPTAVAEPYFKVADEAIALEGPAFDRNGNLFFVDVYSGRILRLSTGQTLSVFYTDTTLGPAGIAIHKDGRIFVAGVGDFAAGKVVAIDPDGSHCHTIVPASAGFVPDDLVFDEDGGFYFTDFKGGATRPEGGVYYVSPDFETITAVLPNVCAANGVTLSPDGKVLWATEFCAGRLHRMDLASPTTIGHFGSTVPYHFIGRSPDSMRTDANGNVYVAMYQQGRILAFNPYGMPIGQILLPGREHNQFLKSTSLAFVPGSRDVLIVSRDENGTGGSMIFRAQALAEGVRLFSHQ